MRACGAAAASIAAAALFFCTPAAAQGQVTEPPVQVVPVLTDSTRIESWSSLQPTDGHDDYTMVGNRATLGVAAATKNLEGYGAFQYAQLLNLPRYTLNDGVRRFAAGPGLLYYDAARAPNAYQLYFKALSLRVRNLPHGVSFEFGRMTFESGAEAAGPSRQLTSLARERLHGRLLGEVGWSAFERTFDGVRVDVARPQWHVNAGLLFPSQGAFEESANATMSGVRVATASITFWNSAGARPGVGPIARLAQRPRLHERDGDTTSPLAFEVQAFAQHYRDVRSDKLRPDVSFGPAPVNVAVETYGGSVVGFVPVRSGRLDAVFWVAGQAGNWYLERQRALSVIGEAGYRWTSIAWRPWLRGGVTYASGDEAFNDGRHNTFFPGLPSSRPFLLDGLFAQMNLRDVFGEVRMAPRSRVGIAGSVHRLSLPSDADSWYSGTGATAVRGSYFGYTARSSFGSDPGTLIQTSLGVEMSSRWTLRGSLGLLRTGLRPYFRNNRLTVFAFENLLTF